MMSRDSFLTDVSVDADLAERAVNAIRMLSADGVQAANSGHPGMPMGMALAAFELWSNYLQFNPSNPAWANRDRFVLSAGHGSMLLYSLLYLTGYDLALDELRNFRQWGSRTPGHPEVGHTPGVETTTGPLGQGFTNGVGMAIAERWLAERFNRPNHTIVDHNVYAIVSDGDLMEGVASEAASLAGHLKLGKIVYLYDNNSITIDGRTDVSYTEDWAGRFRAYGWHVQDVDGTDAAAISAAIGAAHSDPRPSIIGCRSIIGFGSPHRQGTSKAHGEPLGAEELAATKENLGWPQEPTFFVPDDVLALFRRAVDFGADVEGAYDVRFATYAEEYPAEAEEYQRMLSGELPEGWEEVIPVFAPGGAEATRNSGGKVINAIAAAVPNLVGGSADLAGSNKTTINGQPFIDAGSFAGPNIHFGVREHGMAGILNGMALHGGLIPHGATFLVFSDYMRGSMRLAALMGVRVIYVLTHDSIGLGEDGPTHQPVEQLAALRAIPNMTVMRPADANETAQAWRAALLNTSGPTVMALTRQNIPIHDREAEKLGAADGVAKGGYVFYDAGDGEPDVVVVATGSEVEIAYDGAKELANKGISARVVSLPSWEFFEAQSEEYRASVLPAGVPTISIEAAITFGWTKWTGTSGINIGIDHFGASAPYQRVYSEFGITSENVVAQAQKLLER